MRDEPMLWFDNPPRRKRRGKKRRRKLYGAAAAAHAKKVRAAHHRRSPRRRKGAPKVARKRRRKLYGAAAKAHARAMGRGGRKHRRRSHGKRRWRRTSASVARRAGRQLRYRRSNPPMTFRGITKQLMDGAVDATEVVVGKAVSRAIPSFFNLPQTGAVGLAVQVGAALVAGYLARNISNNASKMVLAGGLAAPIESFIKGMNLPIISAALGDGEGYYAVGAYPGGVPVGAGVGAYPALSGDEDASDGVYGY